jgi:NTE family protein
MVLSGGGARGAYQAGVLSALSEIAHRLKVPFPYHALSGVSAGAINATALASFAHSPLDGAHLLRSVWETISPDRVFRTDMFSIGRIGMRWMKDLSMGGMGRSDQAKALLDTTPLGHLIREKIPFDYLKRNLDLGHFHAIAVTATNYANSHSIAFVQGATPAQMWRRTRRRSFQTEITAQHVLASSAIPIFFPPIEIDGVFYGDGCLRNPAFISPALHMGAEKLIIVGVRRADAPAGAEDEAPITPGQTPSLARIMSIILNSLFFDGIEFDAERLIRINETVRAHPEGVASKTSDGRSFSFKPIDFLWIKPSEDIGALAKNFSDRLPKVIQYLLRGMGTTEEASDIISYLLFDSGYCTYLVELGYRDTLAQRAEIEAFLTKDLA